MKTSELVTFLQRNIEIFGDLQIVCPGDHQMYYKVRGVDATHVEDITEYMLEEVHAEDVEDRVTEGGNPIKVLVIYG